MTIRIIRFLNIMMVGMIAGIVFGIWLGYNPKDLSAPTFIEQQQNAIRALNVIMPLLGLFAIILTLINAYLNRKDRGALTMLLVAALFLVASGLTTKFGNQPINSVVMTWDMNSPPDSWEMLRNEWWNYHILRTLTTMVGFGMIVWTGVRKLQTL